MTTPKIYVLWRGAITRLRKDWQQGRRKRDQSQHRSLLDLTERKHASLAVRSGMESLRQFLLTRRFCKRPRNSGGRFGDRRFRLRDARDYRAATGSIRRHIGRIAELSRCARVTSHLTAPSTTRVGVRRTTDIWCARSPPERDKSRACAVCSLAKSSQDSNFFVWKKKILISWEWFFLQFTSSRSNRFVDSILEILMTQNDAKKLLLQRRKNITRKLYRYVYVTRIFLYTIKTLMAWKILSQHRISCHSFY